MGKTVINNEELIAQNLALKEEVLALKRELGKQTTKYYYRFDRATSGLFRCKTDGSLVEANNAFMVLAGFDHRKEMMDELGSNNFLYQQLVTKNEPQPFYSNVDSNEISITNFKGKTLEVIISWQIIEEGKEIYVDGSFVDVTQQKSMELKNRQFYERLQSTQAAAKIAFFDYNAQEDKVLWSKDVGALLDRSKDFTLKHFFSFIHPDDQEFVRATFQNAIESKRSHYEIDYKILNASNEVIYIKSSVNNYFEGGEFIGSSGWLQDVTQLRVAKIELRRNLNMIESILNTIPVSVFWKDTDLNYKGCNNRFLSDVGLRYPKDLIGKTDQDLHWRIEMKELMHDDDSFVIETGEGLLNYEGPLRRADGTNIWIRGSKVPMRNADGEIVGVLGVHEDVSVWKKTQNELLDAYTKIEESDRLKSRFLANISHEVRTPLSAIVGFSDMLGKGDIPQAEIEYFTRLIQNQADHLLKIVSDVLDVSLIESDQIKIDSKPFDVIELLNDQFLILQNQLQRVNNDHIRVRLSVPDNVDLKVVGDKVRVRQILNNLIDNAIKFTQFGFIEIGCQADNNKNLLLFVKDSGIGITPELQKIIFSRFRQGDDSTSKQYPGLGLGLSIAQELTERMDGEIWVESEPEMGSSFYFTLPILHEEKGNPDSLSQPPAFKHNESNWRGRSILVADDVKHLHQLINLFVREKEVKVISAMNGEEAISLVQKNPDIDMILMDIQMPGVDGVEAMEVIKNESPTIPIVAFTAYAMAGDREKYLDLGFDNYVSKPLSQEDLWQLFSLYLKK